MARHREPDPPEDRPGQPSEEAIEEAVRALQAGAGPEAFEPIYRRFYPEILKLFRNRRPLREEARDLAQEALHRAYEKIGSYRGDAPLASWIRRIAVNLWNNALESRRRQEEKVPTVAMEQSGGGGEGDEPRRLPVADRAPDPEARALGAERSRVLRSALAELPPGQRRCTVLRVYHDLQYQEIADRLGVGLNTVRSELHAARQRLQPILQRYFDGAEL